MSHKNTISMRKTINVISKYDIYEKNFRCHIEIRYLREKPLMSNKNSMSMGKTIDVL